MFIFYWKKNDDEWHEISELELHAKLYNYVKQTTPIIKTLLSGKIYTRNNESFKIVLDK